MIRAAVYGTGAVGSRVARQLMTAGPVEALVLIENDLTVAEEVALSLGAPATSATINALRLETRVERFLSICNGLDLVVLTASQDHAELAAAALHAGLHVVSASDELDTVRQLLALVDTARNAKRNLIIGAGFAPGLTC